VHNYAVILSRCIIYYVNITREIVFAGFAMSTYPTIIIMRYFPHTTIYRFSTPSPTRLRPLGSIWLQCRGIDNTVITLPLYGISHIRPAYVKTCTEIVLKLPLPPPPPNTVTVRASACAWYIIFINAFMYHL